MTKYYPDQERRLESIALIYAKQREAGEKPDMPFSVAARAMGFHDETLIMKIRKRGYDRLDMNKRLASPCIFAEAERIANLKL